jgi:GxxExxY protein
MEGIEHETIEATGETTTVATHTPPTVTTRCTIDTFDIQEMASRIMIDLGAGYSENVYQRALFNKIIRIDPTTVMEQTIPVIYENEIIGTCRADIVTANHVIEIKAVRTMPSNVGNQIRKYMKNLFDKDRVPREGVVVNFNQEAERLDFLTFNPASPGPPGPAAVEYRRRRVTPCE